MEEENIQNKVHEKDKDLAIIKAAFENGRIEKMSDLEKLSPTKIAFLAGINQGRYASKLFHPDKFSLPEIIRISIVLDLDESYILKVIRKQLIKRKWKPSLKINPNITRTEAKPDRIGVLTTMSSKIPLYSYLLSLM